MNGWNNFKDWWRDDSKAGPPVVGVVCIAMGVVLLGGVASCAFAQSASSTSNSSASGSAAVTANTDNSNSSAIYFDQRSGGTTKSENKSSGGYTLRSAPSVQAPSMGSGHPCGLGGSIGISIIGGGAAGGVTQVDEACLLAQMGQGEAALIMIARRDKEACVALRQVGRIPAASVCSQEERRANDRQAREQRSATPPKPATIECVRTGTQNGRPVIQARYRASETTAEQASAYCRNRG